MNDLQVFNNMEFGEFRTVIYNGKPYAVGVDVARILEYSNPSKAVIDHCKGITKLGIPSSGGMQESNIIPEGDIYRLIIKAADQGKNPKIQEKAEKFERWLFDEILPEIRQTGGYSMNPPDMELIVRDTIEKSVGIVIKQLLPLVHTIIETSASSAVQHIVSKNNAIPCEINSNQKSQSIIDKLDINKIIMIEAMLCSGELTFSDIVEVMEGNNVFITIADVYEYAKTIKVI